jgi:hypothetical protein
MGPEPLRWPHSSRRHWCRVELHGGGSHKTRPPGLHDATGSASKPDGYLLGSCSIATARHDIRRSHTGRDVLTLFRGIDMHIAPDLELHVILHNVSDHKSQPVRDCLAHKNRRRWHLHSTPTRSSWLNLVEFRCSLLSRNDSTNTSFTSVAELEARIGCWVSRWNDNPEPFVWTKPADKILDHIARGQAALDRITRPSMHHGGAA